MGIGIVLVSGLGRIGLSGLLLLASALIIASATASSRLDVIDLPLGFFPEGITNGDGWIAYVGSLASEYKVQCFHLSSAVSVSKTSLHSSIMVVACLSSAAGFFCHFWLRWRGPVQTAPEAGYVVPWPPKAGKSLSPFKRSTHTSMEALMCFQGGSANFRTMNAIFLCSPLHTPSPSK